MSLFTQNQQVNPDPYKNPVDRKRVVIFGGVIAAVVIGAMLFLVSLMIGHPKEDLMTFIAHEEDLQKIIHSSQKRIRSADLAKVNSDADLLLSTASASLRTQLVDRYGEKAPTTDIIKRARDTTVEDTLKQAELLSKFDNTYIKMVRKKLNALIAEARTVKQSVGGDSLNQVVDGVRNDLSTIDNQLNKLNL